MVISLTILFSRNSRKRSGDLTDDNAKPLTWADNNGLKKEKLQTDIEGNGHGMRIMDGITDHVQTVRSMTSPGWKTGLVSILIFFFGRLSWLSANLALFTFSNSA